MTTTTERLLSAGTVEEVRARGCTVVTGGGHAIAVFPMGERFAAVDNRCPHMGFPLDRGTVSNGILTCHWHHARFDLSSGGTFDPFADDVRAFPVTVTGGQVWVDPSPPEADPVERWSRRLEDGMEHNIRLVIAKSVLGLSASPADYRTPLTIGARFGTTYSDRGWGQALTMMTCSANMLGSLYAEDRPLALYQGIRQVAAECAGRPPMFLVDPLPTGETRPEVFKGWFRGFIEVRDEEGAERCLRTAIGLGISSSEIADMVFAAATDRTYLDAGHVVDFCNKAFELLDHIGWEHAGRVLTSLVPGIASARRSEELNSWRNPIDLSSMVWEARDALPELWRLGADSRGQWDDERPLVDTILADDPAATLHALRQAVQAGAAADQLGGAVAYAAFLRMARFHTSNEFGDWDTVHNTLTAANALHQALKRAPSVELLRAVFDTAISIYLDRFLNMPAQRMPRAGRRTGVGRRRPEDSGGDGLAAAGRTGGEARDRLRHDRRASGRRSPRARPRHAEGGLHLPPLPDRRRGAEAVRGAQGYRRGAARARRSGQVPGCSLPDAQGREPDIQHRRTPAARRRDLQRGVGRPAAEVRSIVAYHRSRLCRRPWRAMV